MRKWNVPLLLILLTILFILMLSYPHTAWQAGERGLAIWWDVLFPSLFPFFILSELMLGFGIVHFAGMLMDPLMKPLFRIPGSGGFVAAMSFASGYPVSAKLTAKLREQQLLTREEGERLVAFTTTSDPIFLIGAVAVGFFHNAELAGTLALAHYGSAILVGLLMRFHAKNAAPSPQTSYKRSGFSMRKAIHAMHQARILDGRSLGEMLKQAVTSALSLMTVVGGLVVVFCVLLEVLRVSGMMTILYQGIGQALLAMGLPSQLAEPFVGGTFEVTLGAQAAATVPAGIPLVYKVAAAAFVLSWAGLSVHAQILSILNATDLRYLPFVIARLIHGIFAFVIVFFLWPFTGPDQHPVFQSTLSVWHHPAWSEVPSSLTLCLQIALVLLILSFSFYFIQRTWSNRKGSSHK
ncbi:sporulation integral membrane protein YlbJ [Paenibacillus shirakamiensis]|uniref:Sporulation integral membrane protein YlbJ n=1 Tax=Paenibacillus shirakamiensis TaxID=1265935 RepID=A0ABS4JK14_9BACL|nr:sporulation integral membrane protein YlbJ [Paenibacillus shirakamiensis]MBP2002040.1 sporulation integral membrane protein YlbJ [Paenibacillus shirakamiensis]